MVIRMKDFGPFSLNGKRALVTGGSMGIGMGIVKRYVEAGSKVMIADKATEKALEYVKTLPADLKNNVAVFGVDLLTEGASEKMINETVHKFGGIDILVNNAGIYPSIPMLEMTEDLFDKVYKLNLRALAFACKAAARQMISQKNGGKIVNIGSIDSVHPSAIGLAAYDASKGGVLMFTKNFALEVAKHKINVNAIAPGGIMTEGTSIPMTDSKDETMKKMMENFLNQIPLGRMGLPDDIAKVAVFLASSASDYMTGTLTVVDGGRLLG